MGSHDRQGSLSGWLFGSSPGNYASDLTGMGERVRQLFHSAEAQSADNPADTMCNS